MQELGLYVGGSILCLWMIEGILTDLKGPSDPWDVDPWWETLCDECGTPASELTEDMGTCQICEHPYADPIDL